MWSTGSSYDQEIPNVIRCQDNWWKGYALTFMHWKYQCTGSQGSPGLGYSPLTAAVWLLQAGKQLPVVSCRLPLPGMWRHMCHTKFLVDGIFSATSLYTSYTGGIKVAAPLSQRVLLPFHKLENLSNPLASWVTMILPWALPGTPAVFKQTTCVWVVDSFVVTLTGRLICRSSTSPELGPGECL